MRSLPCPLCRLALAPERTYALGRHACRWHMPAMRYQETAGNWGIGRTCGRVRSVSSLRAAFRPLGLPVKVSCSIPIVNVSLSVRLLLLGLPDVPLPCRILSSSSCRTRCGVRRGKQSRCLLNARHGKRHDSTTYPPANRTSDRRTGCYAYCYYAQETSLPLSSYASPTPLAMMPLA